MSNSEKYSKIFIKAFSVDKSKLNKLKYQSVPKWDSVGHMSMIAKLEEEFNITFEMDDIIDFSSFLEGKKILKKYKIKI
tara:strand:+ start:151 stop:387 length:237 start_codon:yes stop_codon:yes gene_type:complete